MKKTIKDYNLNNKKVIIRCDLNVPMKDNIILDDTRIKASLKTIKHAIDNNAKVIILSHLGKVKSEEDKKEYSLLPVAKKLGELLNKNIIFSKETRGKSLEELVSKLECKDILLIENTRHEDYPNKLESKCDLTLASYWASFGDVFINDAYGTCHRKHASNVGVSSYLPSGLGFLVEEEVSKLDEIIKEKSHPFVVVMGGKKVNDKIPVIKNLINKCDKLLIGGGMAYTFLKALGYSVGNSVVDEDSITFCKEMLVKYSDKIILPKDIIVSTSIEDINNITIKDIDNIEDKEMGLDIGPKTISLFSDILKEAKRVIINGPMGVFEVKEYSKGTKSIYEVLTTNNVKTVIGGGDSASSVNKLGFKDKFYHISTGGGATLEYLSGVELEAIKVISDK